ncbi:MAG: hypothetical protein EB054_01810 [Actinobacteria bacterium]|nr:hypothetical protein [Actinomycetota bacterium]
MRILQWKIQAKNLHFSSATSATATLFAPENCTQQLHPVVAPTMFHDYRAHESPFRSPIAGMEIVGMEIAEIALPNPSNFS